MATPDEKAIITPAIARIAAFATDSKATFLHPRGVADFQKVYFGEEYLVVDTCTSCGKEEPMQDTSRSPHKEWEPLCAKCLEICKMEIRQIRTKQAEEYRREDEARRERDAEQRRVWHFEKEIPPRYRRASLEKVRKEYQPIMSIELCHDGFGVIGPAGIGKTSVVAVYLTQRWKDDFLWRSGAAIRETANAAACSDLRSPERTEWGKIFTAPVLVLDDVSQAVFSSAWSSKLFDLLEARTSTDRPTIWTSQLMLPELRAKIAAQNGGDDKQAQAICRRMGQHSKVFEIGAV